jgi:hypothetical protein
VDKDRDVQDRIRGQMMHLNPPVMKEATEKIRNWKTEALKNMRKKNDRFVSPLMRKTLPHRSAPMDQFPRLKKMALDQIQEMGVGALTRLPPVDLRLANGSVVHLPLCSRSLRRHKNDSLLLHARGLVVASFSRHLEARVDEFSGGGRGG